MAFDTFDHLSHLKEQSTSVEQLEKLGSVWISPDMAVEKPTVIPPERLMQDVGIVVNKKDLPPNVDITRGAMSSLRVSVRSFFAQVGIDVVFHGGALSDEMLEKINSGADTVIPIDVINHGKRAVELEGDVMRFFWVNDLKRLRGPELMKAIESGEFTVEGVEGEDWSLFGHDPDLVGDEHSEEKLGVAVRLKPEKYYVPYSPEPVRKNSTLKTRDDLATLLKPIPASEEINFEIRETPKVRLGEDLVAVINTGVEGDGQRHINSPLIDAGSDWPIRTETTHGLKNIDFFLYKK